MKQLRDKDANAKKSATAEVETVGPLVDSMARRIEDIAILLENS